MSETKLTQVKNPHLIQEYMDFQKSNTDTPDLIKKNENLCLEIANLEVKIS